MLILVLIGSTSCRTRSLKTDETSIRSAIASTLPKAPELPTLPNLHWVYMDGLYGLEEKDVDILLDFFENSLTEFYFDYTAWQKEVDVVIRNLV